MGKLRLSGNSTHDNAKLFSVNILYLSLECLEIFLISVDFCQENYLDLGMVEPPGGT